jgi:uncharacterized protein (DUF427 family)
MSNQPMTPGQGQECIWDYPTIGRIEDSTRHVRVIFDGVVVAETRRAKRLVEHGCAPVFYIPPDDVKQEYLEPSDNTST